MISLLVATDKNRVIGANNQLPWHLPADLSYFKRVTMGHPIVMGRKTHESIGRALPGRENIVITRNKDYFSQGCKILHSIDEFKAFSKELIHEEIFVIGGAKLFNQLMDFADRLYLTLIEEEFEGDTYFPVLNNDDWKLISKEKGIKDEKNPYDYYYLVYEKNNNR
jgi:dihydrofolate reductase